MTVISMLTKVEAIKLAKRNGNSLPWYEDTVTLLEALGLIKFKPEPEKVISVSLNWMKAKFKAEMMKREYSPDSGSVLDGLDAIIKMFEKTD